MSTGEGGNTERPTELCLLYRQTDTATTSLQTLQNLPVDLALQPPLFIYKILKYLNLSTSGRFFYQPREGKPHFLHQMSRSDVNLRLTS